LLSQQALLLKAVLLRCLVLNLKALLSPSSTPPGELFSPQGQPWPSPRLPAAEQEQ
jgi:hypothetical protein